MRYEIIDNDGNVLNTIVASEEFVALNYPGRYRAVEDTPTPEPVVEDKRITNLAFRLRFTFAERIGIEQAAETDVQVRVLQKDFDAAKFIDLDRAETIAGLNLLASKGLITLARANEILTATITEVERPA